MDRFQMDSAMFCRQDGTLHNRLMFLVVHNASDPFLQGIEFKPSLQVKM